MKNNKEGVYFALAFMMVVSLSLISLVSADANNACSLNVTLINQDPYPAIPNSYVDLVFQVTGVENSQCEGVNFKLNPSYPFSLDVDGRWIRIENPPTSAGYNSNWVIPYKVRIDKDALDGVSELEVDYRAGTLKLDSYVSEKFNITIKDSRTDFDAVIQETSGSTVSIAIANIGKYTANSVIVKVPEQDSFRASGTDGQMVGNLASGDYTIVSFALSPKTLYGARNASRTDAQTPPSQPLGSSTKLKLNISYTDNIGERRTVNMELPLNLITNSSMIGGSFPGRRTTTSSSGGFSWTTLLIILIIIGILYFIYKKYPKQSKEFLDKVNARINKVSSREGKTIPDMGNVTPGWIKNVKEKEKKK